MNQGSTPRPPTSALAPSSLTPADPHPPLPFERHWWQLWPGVLAIVVLLAMAGYGAHQAIVLNGGRLTYPIDDAYGHLAIAKNLAHHGIWGFSYLDGFSSGASSLLWPVLIAICFAVFGTHDYIPFILDLVVASGLLLYAAAMLRRYSISSWPSFLVLLVVTLLTPLPAVAATGMEHCLHALLGLMFVDLSVRVLTGEFPLTGKAARLGLPVLAALLVATRYEGLFIIAVVGFLFLCRGWWRPALIFGVASAVIPTLFGLYSLHKGWYFVPNSLLIKGNTEHFQASFAGVVAYFNRGYVQLLFNPHMIFLILAMLAGLVGSLRRHRTVWSSPVLLLAVTLGVSALHVQYAAFGWFFRYEAYLMVLGLLSLGICLVDAGGPRVVFREPTSAGDPLKSPAPRGRERLVWQVPYAASLVLAGLGFGAPLITRAYIAAHMLPTASHNIYEQQFQMGMFLRKHYQSQGVIANDIGAIDYLADIKLFDIFGLADIDVLRAKRAKSYDRNLISQAVKTHDVRVIIIYDEWLRDHGLSMPEWVPVGQWTLPDNVICGSNTVCFYAPDASLAPELTRALQAYAPSLPTGVIQHGLYRGEHFAPDPLGTYRPELDGAGLFAWTPYGATFFQYPLDGKPAAPAADATRPATLHVWVLPTANCTAVEVSVNGQPVDTHTLSADQASQWVGWEVPVSARAGANTVTLIGRGEPAHLPGDGRNLLFAMRTPNWILSPAPTPPTASASALEPTPVIASAR